MPPLRKANVMRSCGMSDHLVIPLFAKRLAHSSVPLACQAAVTRSGGQGWPQAGASALPLTAASTMAPRNRAADGAIQERTSWTS